MPGQHCAARGARIIPQGHAGSIAVAAAAVTRAIARERTNTLLLYRHCYSPTAFSSVNIPRGTGIRTGRLKKSYPKDPVAGDANQRATFI